MQHAGSPPVEKKKFAEEVQESGTGVGGRVHYALNYPLITVIVYTHATSNWHEW